MSLYSLTIEQIIFLFFFFSITGWIGETIMESLVRKRFVNKGFFTGPYVPIHGIGGFGIYILCNPLKAHPVWVFLTGMIVCTLIEYTAAILLEKVFYIRSWDYDTYPFTKWCHYKRRIALTTSLFFGLVSLGQIYFYWDLGIGIMQTINARIMIIIDILASIGFVLDLVSTWIRYIKNKQTGIPNKTVELE